MIIHPNGNFAKDSYSILQYISRRVFRHGLQHTHQAIENFWETTNALADLLINHDALTQVQHFHFTNLKEMEKKSYCDIYDKLKILSEHLQEAQQNGLKNLIETYNRDCKFEQLATKSIEVLVKKILKKLDALSKLEKSEKSSPQVSTGRKKRRKE